MTKRRVLFLTAYPMEAASDRYRVYRLLPYLERAGLYCEVRPFATPALYRAIQSGDLIRQLSFTPLCSLRRFADLARLSHYDLVVINREAFPLFMPLVEKIILNIHPRVVFAFDDAIHVGHREMNGWKNPAMYRLKYGRRVEEVLRRCVHVVAGNEFLAEYARRVNARVSVIPTVVDLEHYSYQPPARGLETLTIGWVGSRSTSPYLLDLEEALRALAEKHPGRIRFRFVGDPKRRLNLPNYQSLPFRLDREIDDLRGMDIGIMPMPDNEWTRGKCSFKAIQYMALGIPTVVSPVGTAAQLVTDGVNGLWARNSQEWFTGLDRLVRDEELRMRLSQAGRGTIERGYSTEIWGPRFASLLAQVATVTPQAETRLGAEIAN